MRQILYISTSTNAQMGQDLPTILAASRRNNARDGVTGLLWTDGTRFLQVLEGPSSQLETTFSRITADPRHRAIVTLHDRVVERRTFADWAMAFLEDSDERVASALASADAEVRGDVPRRDRQKKGGVSGLELCPIQSASVTEQTAHSIAAHMNAELIGAAGLCVR